MTPVELLCLASVAIGIGDYPKRANFACEHMETVVAATEATNVKPEILVALIHHESRWKPKAVSSAGACGLTQVLPKYTGSKKVGNPKYTCKQLYDPTTSIWAGSRVLSYFTHRYGRGDYKIGLCAYLAGYRCKGKSPNKSGVKYSRMVRRTAAKLVREMEKIKREQK